MRLTYSSPEDVAQSLHTVSPRNVSWTGRSRTSAPHQLQVPFTSTIPTSVSDLWGNDQGAEVSHTPWPLVPPPRNVTGPGQRRRRNQRPARIARPTPVSETV